MPGEEEPRVDRVAQAVATKLDSGTALLLRRELKKLPEMLGPDEAIVRLAQGTCDEVTGMLVATDSRLMFVAEEIVRNTQASYPYPEISGVETQVDVVNSRLTVSTHGEDAVITGIYPKDQAMAIADYVRSRT